MMPIGHISPVRQPVFPPKAACLLQSLRQKTTEVHLGNKFSELWAEAGQLQDSRWAWAQAQAGISCRHQIYCAYSTYAQEGYLMCVAQTFLLVDCLVSVTRILLQNEAALRLQAGGTMHFLAMISLQQKAPCLNCHHHGITAPVHLQDLALRETQL